MPIKNQNLPQHNVVKETTPSHHWDKPFWRGVASTENGVGSTSRVSTLAIMLTSLTVLVYLVLKTGRIPDNLIELGWFSSLLISAVYTPSKIADIFKVMRTPKK